MKMCKKNIWILLFLALCIPCLLGLLYNSLYKQEKIIPIPKLDDAYVRIGFSQTDCSNPWRAIQLMSFKESAKAHGYQLIYYEPEEDTSEWQLKNLRQLLMDHPDYLVISPKELSALKDILMEAEAMGVGVIFVDTDHVSDPDIHYLTRISSSYPSEGRLSARILADFFQGREARILELTGEPDLDYTPVRSDAFSQELACYPNLTLVDTVDGSFDSEASMKIMERIITDSETDFDALFIHSDEAGIGALQALKLAGKDVHTIPIVSINGSQDALKAIIAGEYLATITSSPNVGTVVMSAISQHRAGYKLPNWVIIPNKIYDRTNALEKYNYAY